MSEMPIWMTLEQRALDIYFAYAVSREANGYHLRSYASLRVVDTITGLDYVDYKPFLGMVEDEKSPHFQTLTGPVFVSDTYKRDRWKNSLPKIVWSFVLQMHEFGLTGDRPQAPSKIERYLRNYQSTHLEALDLDDESFADFLVLQLFGLALAFGVLVVEIFHKKLTKKLVKWVRSSYGELRGKLNRLTIRPRRFKPIRIVRPAREGNDVTVTYSREAEFGETRFVVTLPLKISKSVAKA